MLERESSSYSKSPSLPFPLPPVHGLVPVVCLPGERVHVLAHLRLGLPATSGTSRARRRPRPPTTPRWTASTAARRRRLSGPPAWPSPPAPSPTRPSARAPRRARGAAARSLAGPSRRRSAEASVPRGRARPRTASVRRGPAARAPPPRAPSGTPRGGARAGRAPRGRCSRGPSPGARQDVAWVGRARPRRERARARGSPRGTAFPRWNLGPSRTPARAFGTPAAIAPGGFEDARLARASRGRVEHTRRKGALEPSLEPSLEAGARSVRAGRSAPSRCAAARKRSFKCRSFYVERFSFLWAFPRRVRGPKNCLFPRKKAAQMHAF